MIRKTLLSSVAALAASVFASQTTNADGLIVVSNPPNTVPGHFSFAPLEVVHHHVVCDIKDQVAVTSVDQAFYNPNGGRPLEGNYIFPIPKDAQINKFTMEIDGKPMEAELLPADKARGIYEEIVRQSKDPALLEYSGRAMFKVRIFPINANETKKITLKYTEFLKQDTNLLDYHYTLNTEKYSSKPIKNISMKINIESTKPITTLYSPTHEVEAKKHDNNKAVVGFEAKDIRPDTDFHLYIGRKDDSPVGMSVLTYKPDADKEGYFVMMAAPTVSKDVKPQPKDVVFVVDTSGSMNGAKIEQAKKAMKFCVNTMNAGDRFDIVRFSTEAEPFFKKLTDYNDENKAKAVKFIEEFRATGGTAIEDAITASLTERLNDEKSAGRMFMVVFLTDGVPTVGEQNIDKLIAITKKSGAGVRLFSFGIGNDVNTKLLDTMAEQTKGYSQYVLPQEDIEVAVSSFFGKVQDPVIAGVKVDMGAANAMKMYPREMPDMFKGDQLVVFGTYSKSAKSAVVLKGMVNGKEQTFAQDVEFADKTDSSNEWIAKLWATRRVGYLLDEIRKNGESKEVKDEVIELARRWGIVTPYTAMLIIEDERKRGLPVAQRSLREMEADPAAVAVGARNMHGVVAKEDAGGSAVTSSLNANALKEAKSLDGQQQAFAQNAPRLRYQGTSGGAGGAGGVGGGNGLSRGSGKQGAGGQQNGADNYAEADLAKDARVTKGLADATDEWRNATTATGLPNAPAAAPKPVELAKAEVKAKATGEAAAQDVFGDITISEGAYGGVAGSGKLSVAGGSVNLGEKSVVVKKAEETNARDLNLGNQQSNGWNYVARSDDEKKNATGYRIVGNYSQQNRVVNNRAFYLNGNQWTDNRVQNAVEKNKEAVKIKVVFSSAAYFELLKNAEAAQYMALGSNVTFELDGKIYDIVDEEPAVAK